MNTNDLIGQFRAGDPQAFKAIFNMHFKEICNYSIQLTKSDFDGEEIALDSFHKLWIKKEVFESMSTIRAYLYVVAKNACFNFLRNAKVQKKREEEFVNLSKDWENEEQRTCLQGEIFKRIINHAGTTLPTECLKVFEMLYVQGKSRKEVADELGIAIGTVDSHRNRAIKILLGGDLGLKLHVVVLLFLALAMQIKKFF